MPPKLSFQNVSKRYGDQFTVRDISFQVAPGEVFGLLGPEGAGKSTVLNMLTGLVRPTSGTIQVLGKELRKNFVYIAAQMGVLTQPPAFFENLTVRRNLLLQGRLARRDVSLMRVLDWVGLVDAAGQHVGRLGPEARQRFGLAQALISEPDLLVLDEPTFGLDMEASEEIFRLIRRVVLKAGVTVVLASHLMYEVEALCDRVGLLHKGELIACDETTQVISYDPNQVEVLLEGAETAGRRLAEQVWVADVEVRPARVFVQLRERNVHQLCAFLVQAGFKINGVIPRRRTLQEYLLKVMNR
ncbi:MAG: ABC transporter ATP-binding protein [Candidatus Hydrogenedentota bacterium]